MAPVEGQLYLNGQIPRGTIEKATYASAAAAAAASSGVNAQGPASVIKKNEVGWQTDVEGDEKREAAAGGLPAHPTYVLKLSACDSGVPPQCSYFPNLQIQVSF